MAEISIKTIASKAEDIDPATRRVKVAISKMEEIDSDGDLIAAGAYTKTIKERGPKGANFIYHLLDHKRGVLDAIALFSELYVENNTLYGVSEIAKTQNGNDALELYSAGIIKQHSVGFYPIKQEPVTDNIQRTTYTRISEIKLYEGSAVLWGANANTPTISVGKAESSEIEAIDYVLKHGIVSDDAMRMLEIRKKYILSYTSPTIAVTEPDAGLEQLFINALKQIKL